jgi:hypothetical protein
MLVGITWAAIKVVQQRAPDAAAAEIADHVDR